MGNKKEKVVKKKVKAVYYITISKDDYDHDEKEVYTESEMKTALEDVDLSEDSTVLKLEVIETYKVKDNFQTLVKV
jgi:hypothetical protein